MCCDETAEYSVFDGYPNGDVGGRKLRRLARIRRRGTLKLGTEDIEEQSRQAVGYCTRCDITPAIRRPCSLTPWPHYKNRQKHGSMESASCHSPFIRCIPRGALRTSQRKQPIVHKTITALKCLVYWSYHVILRSTWARVCPNCGCGAGAMMAVAWTIGPLIGGPIMTRLKMSIPRTLFVVVIVHTVMCFGYLVAMLLGCPEAEWAGTITQQGSAVLFSQS